MSANFIISVFIKYKDLFTQLINKKKKMKCYIKLRSFNHLILETISDTCLKEAKNTDIQKASLIRLPKEIKKFSLIRSPHVHKKSREQFEIINYKRILFLEGSLETLKNFIDKNITKNKHSFYYKIQWQNKEMTI